MRFMLCARDRVTGDMELLSGSSFTTRREAVEAISDAGDFAALAGMDVFLVDLDVAAPVAIVPWYADDVVRAAGEAEGVGPDDAGEAEAHAAADVAADGNDVAADPDEDAAHGEETALGHQDVDEAASPADDAPAPMVFDMGARLGLVQIDIDEWTCEDCIYVSTCAFSGTRRPAACGAFQWRA
jgi:hypothetical protein